MGWRFYNDHKISKRDKATVIKHRLTFTFFIIIFCFQAFAEKTTIIADADFSDFKNINTPEKTLIYKGNVNILFNQQHLLCDEAIVYEKTNMIVATGNVILQSDRTTLRGEKIEFNYNTNKGKLYNGIVTSGQVLIQSDIIEKIGDDEYVADDAYYTACLTCPPSWGFTSSRITAEIGGYAYISQPWLYLLEFPTLPLPYLVVPLNSNRRTGLLVPNLGSNNRGGLAFEQPFYWAIDRSHDATFTLVNYEKRGQQLLGNYRYVISPESSGELNASILPKDRVENNLSRWFVQYEHSYELPDNYKQRMELVLASDNQYPVDFPKQLVYTGQAALNNNVSITKTYEDSLLSLDSSYYISLLESDFNNSDSLHRMPEINYNLMDQLISENYNLYFNFDLQYLNITSHGSSFRHARYGTDSPTSECASGTLGVCYYNDSPTGNFIYGGIDGTSLNNQQYGDIIRTGQRLDVMPSFHAPFWVGSYLDIDPSLSFRYTQYSLGLESDSSQGYNSFPSRFYTQLGISTKSYISRIFNWSKQTTIKHSIIPEINLRYIPKVHQTQHNFFGTTENLRYFREQQPIDDTDSDWRNGGRGIQFDNNDRVIGKQLVDFGITNKVLSRASHRPENQGSISSSYQQNLLFRVSQVFDINEARRGGAARPWQDIRTQLIFSAGPFSQSLTTSYFPYHGRTRWTATTQYSFLDDSYIGLSYNKNYTIYQDPPVDDATKQEYITARTSLNLKYLTLYGSTDYFLTAKTSKAKFPRWMLVTDIIPPGSCWSMKAGIDRQLGPEEKFVTNIIFNMEFNFSE